jgi:hypothetical protein
MSVLVFPLFACSTQRLYHVPVFPKLTSSLVPYDLFYFVSLVPLQNMPCSLVSEETYIIFANKSICSKLSATHLPGLYQGLF